MSEKAWCFVPTNTSEFAYWWSFIHSLPLLHYRLLSFLKIYKCLSWGTASLVNFLPYTGLGTSLSATSVCSVTSIKLLTTLYQYFLLNTCECSGNKYFAFHFYTINLEHCPAHKRLKFTKGMPKLSFSLTYCIYKK